MEKKRLVDLLLISFLFVLGVYLVSSTVAFNSTGSSVNVSGNDRSYTSGATNGSVWTGGGYNLTEIINFTINFTGGDAISNVNITIPIEAYRLHNRNERNVTISLNNNGGPGNTINWTITNTTNIVILRAIEGNYTVGLKIPLNIEFNVTANRSIEGAFTWNVSFTDNVTGTADIESTTFITYVDGLRPRVTNINVTDGTTILSASAGELNSTKWLKNTSITIYATLTDHNFDEGARPKVYYTTNGTGVNTSSPFYVMSSSNGSAYTYRLNLTIPAKNGEIDGVGNESRAFSFMIQANDTYNNDYIFNTSAQSGFNFTIDGNFPTVTITPPSLTTISVLDSIKYTCSGGDADSGVKSYLWTITKPNDQVITKTTSAITLTGSDTAGAGTYDLTCKVTDNAENSVTSTTYQFTAHITSTGGGAGAGGGDGGGTGAATTEVVEVDNSITDIGEAATITKKQGQSTTFSLDGKTSHSVKFKTVTSGSVTLEIQSDPIEVTLNVGETKQVDVDADGTNDLEVTLESISGGSAQVTMKKIAQTAAEVATPEPTTETGEETTTTPTPSEEAEGGASLVWLWIVIVIIVIVAVVVAVQKRKK